MDPEDYLRRPKLQRKLSKWLDRATILVQGVTSLEGPVERIDDKLTLRIPLSAGGAKLARCSKGIAYIREESLIVVIQDWLAEKIRVTDGTIVCVDNRDGRFNITVKRD